MMAPCMAPSLATVLATGNSQSTAATPTSSKSKSSAFRDLNDAKGITDAKAYLSRKHHPPPPPKQPQQETTVSRSMTAQLDTNPNDHQPSSSSQTFRNHWNNCMPVCCIDQQNGGMSPRLVCCVSHAESKFQRQHDGIKICLQATPTSSDISSSIVHSPVLSDRIDDTTTLQVSNEEGIMYGSDFEEEGEGDCDVEDGYDAFNAWTHPHYPNGKMRGNQRHLYDSTLEFSLPSTGEMTMERHDKGRPFLYETVLSLWLQSWMDDAASQHKPNARRRTKQDEQDSSSSSTNSVFAFTAHIDLLLPLCLKSLVLRCTSANPGKSPVPLSVLDMRHMSVLVPVIEIWARGIMSQALSTTGDVDYDISPMDKAIRSNHAVSDFLIGLLAVIHPAQVSLLISNYFDTLQDCDIHTIPLGTLTPSELKRIISTRQLRLCAVEKFASIPRFVALNYPLKYPKGISSTQQQRRPRIPSHWTKQILERMPRPRPHQQSPYPDHIERIPKAHWLAELLTDHCLSICAKSCEAVVAEAVAQMTSQDDAVEALKRKPSLSKEQLLQFQSTAVHSVTCVYDLLMKRHSIDARFQSEEGRRRIAAMFVVPMVMHSLRGVQWLARMESTHKVRVLWLMSFLYVLQEAPEVLMREQLRMCCLNEEILIHKFIRLLKLSSTSFQCFISNHPNKQQSPPPTTTPNFPWLLQESFNVICATTNMLVDECADLMLSHPLERKKMAHGILDLLLQVITTPQCSVTHLRALGGASQALEKFGAALFLEAVGDNLQHWARIILSLMNSLALSVRSIGVDFMVSLLGGGFDASGNIDEIAVVFLTVMPEVVAREIGLYGVGEQIKSMEDVECALWPLRRAIADVEEANPIDDDRVDVHLAPLLGVFCRTCQAVIDGVLIELRLMGKECDIVGTKVYKTTDGKHSDSFLWSHTFDADEESLYEAANFFLPETAPLQRLRWLMTLKSLHEAKGQWVEAAETLLLCARTVADAIPHVKGVWRPSRFSLWHDSRRSRWLSTIVGRGATNKHVMEFADGFLEPPNLLGIANATSTKTLSGKLYQPTVAVMCRLLTSISKEAVLKYLEEDGMESLALLRLEQLLKTVMDVVEDRGAFGYSRSSFVERRRPGTNNVLEPDHTLSVEENAALRKMSASLNGDMTKLAERMLLLANEETTPQNVTECSPTRHYYVRVILSGRKPDRFVESTTIPTFLEWENPSICRVPKDALKRAFSKDTQQEDDEAPQIVTATDTVEERICASFAQPFLLALSKELPLETIQLGTELPDEEILSRNEEKTFVIVTLVHPVDSRSSQTGSKRFFFRNQVSKGGGGALVSSAGWTELTVGQRFPCALSRQRTIITSEYFS